MKIRMAFMTLLALTTVGALTACAPQKPLTYEQQALQEAQQECSNAATSMNDGPYNSSNPLWNSYFEMCMRTRFNVTNAQLKTLWY